MAPKYESKQSGPSALTASVLAASALAWTAWKIGEQARRDSRKIDPGQKIVVLGGGFAGVEAALALVRELPASSDAEIILVDQNDFLLFTPMLTEVAGGMIDPRHIVSSLRTLPPRIQFVQGKVCDVDLDNKQVTVERGGGSGHLPADSIVLKATQILFALGSTSNYHKAAGAEEHSFSVKSVQEASRIASRVLTLLERADAEHDPAARRKYLTFVVAGGGYTGVETLAAINDLARENVRYYHNVSEDDIRCVIAFAEERILNELTADLAEYATEKLKKRGVDFWPKTSVVSASDNSVTFDNGAIVDTYLLVWAGGVKPSPVLDTVDAPKSKIGALQTDEFSRVADRDGVWAVGDCAAIPQPVTGKPYPPTAQDATREGGAVANNIIAALAGESLKPFKYKPVGELALVGKTSGVARVYGINFSGLIAWAMWRAIYLAKMPGLRNKLHIGVDWIIDALFGLDTIVTSGQPNQ